MASFLDLIITLFVTILQIGSSWLPHKCVKSVIKSDEKHIREIGGRRKRRDKVVV